MLLVLLLTGCAATAPAPQIVKVPVSTPCLGKIPARPDFEFAKLTSAATDGDKVLALVRDWLLGRKYEMELEATIEGCQ